MVTVSKELQQTLQNAVAEARRRRNEYVTLEHLLHAMVKDKVAAEVLVACGADLSLLEKELTEYLDRTLEAGEAEQEPEQTAAFQRVLQRAAWHVQGTGRTELNAGDVLVAITREKGSHAVYLLEKQGVRRIDILQYISHGIGKEGGGDDEPQEDGGEETGAPRTVKDPFKTFTVKALKGSLTAWPGPSSSPPCWPSSPPGGCGWAPPPSLEMPWEMYWRMSMRRTPCFSSR